MGDGGRRLRDGPVHLARVVARVARVRPVDEEGGSVDDGDAEVLAHDQVADGQDDGAVLPHHGVGPLNWKRDQFLLEKSLAYSKFVSLFTFVALSLPSSGKAQEENAKISQTLTTQNSSLV